MGFDLKPEQHFELPRSQRRLLWKAVDGNGCASDRGIGCEWSTRLASLLATYTHWKRATSKPPCSREEGRQIEQWLQQHGLLAKYDAVEDTDNTTRKLPDGQAS